MKMLSVQFLPRLRFRVNKKEGKIKKRRVIEKVAAYKYIPRHIISFEHMIFFEQKS